MGLAALTLGVYPAQTTPTAATPGTAAKKPATAKVTTPFFQLTDKANKELPRWLRFSGDYRIREEGFFGQGFKDNNNDLYLLNRMRVNMNLIPTSWMKFEFQGQDSRVFMRKAKPYGPPMENTWDLRLANVEFGDQEKKHIGLRFGRQEINLGEERLVGSTNWANGARTFDAARLMLGYGKFRLDLFAAAPVQLYNGEVGSVVGGNNLHGMWGKLINVVPNSTVEPYVLWRLNRGMKMESGKLGNLDSKTVGVRWVGKLGYGFDYNTDFALQRGGLGSDGISAGASHVVIGRTFQARWKPRYIVEYNFASGDSNSTDGHRGTFDQLFPTAHDKYGMADQVGWKNIHHARTGVELTFTKKFTGGIKYDDYWLANSHDGLYNTGSTVLAISKSGAAGRWVGQEIDGVVAYKLYPKTQLGAGVGHLFPGTFLKLTTPGHSYTYPYVFLSTAF